MPMELYIQSGLVQAMKFWKYITIDLKRFVHTGCTQLLINIDNISMNKAGITERSVDFKPVCFIVMILVLVFCG